MQRSRSCLALPLLFLSLLAHSAGADERTQMETWYTYWGGGYAGMSYPGDLDDLLEFVESLPGVDRLTLGLDMLGFYFPVDERTVLGFVVNGAADRVEVSSDEWMQINSLTYAFSVMRYLQHRVGDGFFVRGDLGPAIHTIEGKRITPDSSEWGLGGLVGAGYGLPVGLGTQLLLNLNSAVRQVEGDATTTLGVSLGGLFWREGQMGNASDAVRTPKRPW